MREDKHLAEALESLACAIRTLAEQLSSQNGTQAILDRIAQLERNMTKEIQEFSDAVDVKFTEIGNDVDELLTNLGGVAKDVQELKDIITKLETNPGPISAEDQALLTSAVAKVTALSERVKAANAAVKALDDATETPPVPPQT